MSPRSNRYLHIHPSEEWRVQPNLATPTSTPTSTFNESQLEQSIIALLKEQEYDIYLESRDQTHSRIIHVKFNWLCGFSKNSLYLCRDYRGCREMPNFSLKPIYDIGPIPYK